MIKLLNKLAFMTSLLSAFAVHAESSSTLIFVHGANFTADSWQLVQDKLPCRSSSVAVDLPGRKDSLAKSKVNLQVSAEALVDVIEVQKQGVILVVHSQGGAVVNHAIGLLKDSAKVKAVLYVAAVVPEPGEKPFALLSKEDEKNYFAGIEFAEESLELKIKDNKKFLATFAPEASKVQKEAILESAVSEPAEIGEGKVQFNAAVLAKIPKYYVHTKNDLIVSLASQRKYVERLSFKKVYELEAGHLPMITKSEDLADIIKEIAVLK